MSKPTASKGVKEEVQVVVPSVSIEGHVNPAIKAVNEGLETKAVGVFRRPDSNEFVSFVVELEGTKVKKFTLEEPNIRQIAEETAKISFVQLFMGAFDE